MKKNLIGIVLVFSISYSSFAQWQQCIGSENLDVQAVHVAGNFGFFGGASGIYRSLDESATYTFSNSGNDAVGPTRGITSDGTYIYTCTSQGVFRSSDSGQNWISKSNGLTQLLGHGIISTENKIFLSTLSGVFKSTDNGDNWTAAGMVGIDSRSICSMQDSMLFVGTQGSGIFKSIDDGQNWTAVSAGITSVNFRAIQAEGNTVFAGGQNGTGVYRSLDYGATWTLLTSGIASSSYRGFASNNNLIVAGSFTDGVFYSIDNGDNWTQINQGLLDLNVFDLEINNNYIIAGTHSRGVFRFPLSSTVLSLPTSELSLSVVSISPNPSSDVFNISFNQAIVGKTTVRVMNLAGQVIESVELGELEGAKTISIDAGKWANGTYVLELSNNGTTSNDLKIVKK